LPPAELVKLLMTSLELHPDLPIFPLDEVASPSGALTPIQSSQKTSVNSPVRKSQPKKFVPGTPFDPDEEDPTGLMEAWPRPGFGMYTRLPLEWEDALLVDKDDSGSFSHIVYDSKGDMIMENGHSMAA
jgi:hypothetical protein